MSVDFLQSKTGENLMRAFAGESQARNRYLFAAGMARRKNLQVIERLFLFTAAQEQEHAKVFYHLLAPMTGRSITVDGSYPVDIYSDLPDHLKAARHNEYEEFEQAYPAFAQIAQEEGFAEVAHIFRQIAAVEKTHGDRFARYAKLLEGGTLFASEQEQPWMCLNCGHIVTATAAPGLCPVCKHAQGFFLRADEPFF